MTNVEGIGRHFEANGLYLSLRLGPCGQWKVRLYEPGGRKAFEAVAPNVGRCLTLALRWTHGQTNHLAA
jgi:hypothetical protein